MCIEGVNRDMCHCVKLRPTSPSPPSRGRAFQHVSSHPVHFDLMSFDSEHVTCIFWMFHGCLLGVPVFLSSSIAVQQA